MATEFDQKLELVRQKCLNCCKCSLCKTKTNAVFSAGVPNSKIMLIGEARGIMKISRVNLLSARPDNFWIKS